VRLSVTVIRGVAAAGATGPEKQYNAAPERSFPQRILCPLQYARPFSLPFAVLIQVQPDAQFCGVTVVGVIVTKGFAVMNGCDTIVVVAGFS
jgi:hypothetical protein